MKHTQLLITAMLSSPPLANVAELTVLKLPTHTVHIFRSKTLGSVNQISPNFLHRFLQVDMAAEVGLCMWHFADVSEWPDTAEPVF